MQQPTPEQRIAALERQCRMLRDQRDTARGNERRLRASICDLWEMSLDASKTRADLNRGLDDLHSSLDLARTP